MTFFPSSELILNSDGSIYHLGLKPGEIADTIITVGDPNRVDMLTKHFDNIELKRSVREFVTHTGTYKGKRLTVISTGIGTDNIDIVFNELDALANIDFESRTEKEKHSSLNFIRIGTSGALQEYLDVDTVLASAYGIDLGPLQHFYADIDQDAEEKKINEQIQSLLNDAGINDVPTSVSKGSQTLIAALAETYHKGITLTAPGFYGPQGRSLRAKSKLQDAFFNAAANTAFGSLQLTNFEMETAGIYSIANMLGHEAISINLLLANRQLKKFSNRAQEGMENLVVEVLENIVNKL